MDSLMEKNFLQEQATIKRLFIYRKADVIYRMTVLFCGRFLPHFGDRTVDQMVQAARSGKQNIVEGCSDGVTSKEMEIKLLNVARASFAELKEDFMDYLNTHDRMVWQEEHPQYRKMLAYCRCHNDFADYEGIFNKGNDETLANVGMTLCRIEDKMLCTFLQRKEREFIQNGGIRERMSRARKGYLDSVEQERNELRRENESLKKEIQILLRRLEEMKMILGTRSERGWIPWIP
ncbi:MAG: four helix bundle suffix domain-containing protein [Oligosphaeraceae bacterium]